MKKIIDTIKSIVEELNFSGLDLNKIAFEKLSFDISLF